MPEFRASDAHVFCFGLGFTAGAFARLILAEGGRVSGTCRSSEKCLNLMQEGITAQIYDAGIPLEHDEYLSQATTLLVSVPPSSEGCPVLAEFGAMLAESGPLTRVLYLSTTGVYGDTQGAWVDETAPVLSPSHERGAARVTAEEGWSAWAKASGKELHIFRLSGIYGPGRNALEEMKRGTARRIIKEGQVFSRVHVEDAARVIIRSLSMQSSYEIWNCADDLPAPSAEVTEYAAELLNLPPPPPIGCDHPSLSDMARSFYAACRRVCNNKIKTKLGQDVLQYPTYRDGLRAELKRATGVFS